MPTELVVSQGRQLAKLGFSVLPAVVGNAGVKAAKRFLEFFTANIRNPNTRRAYAKAVWEFMLWCDAKRIALDQIEPMLVAAYIEQLGQTKAAPTVKQALAAVRMLFEYLVVGQVLPMNPASSVRGPKHVVKKGKTPVLEADQARELLDSIDVGTPGEPNIVGLRDRAIIATMVFSFARISAVLGMNVEDFFSAAVDGRFACSKRAASITKCPLTTSSKNTCTPTSRRPESPATRTDRSFARLIVGASSRPGGSIAPKPCS